MNGSLARLWIAGSMLAACAAAPVPAVAAAAPHFALAGAPTVLISNDQRAELGIRFGPDTPVDFFQGRDGRYYINSAGSLGPVQGPGHPAAWVLHVDSRLTQVLALNSDGPATGPADIRTIMTTHAAECGSKKNRLRIDDPGGAACNQYFDRDYAGGGSYFRCPDRATSAYFYHGENHTAPDGTAGHGGWFGIGVGLFNADETQVTRATQMDVADGRTSAQIIGLNLQTAWRAQGADGARAEAPQAHPYNGAPSVAPGADGYLYVYHGNATLDPAYNPSSCHPQCMSVSRAPVAAFCTGLRTRSPVQWQNYYKGGWTEPAVQDGRSSLGYGAGGAFTPLVRDPLPGEHGGTVTYLPARHLYVMARVHGNGVLVRTSSDGLAWSGGQQLVDSLPDKTANGDPEQLLYPRVSVIEADGREQYVLTYTAATLGHFWRWAELMRQGLTLG